MRPSILVLALEMLACIISAPGRGQSPEANPVLPNRFVYRPPTIRGRDSIALDYIRFTGRLFAIKDRKEAMALARRKFEDIRRNAGILDENIFVSKILYMIPEDSGFIPLAITVIDQLVIDNDSLLSGVTDKSLQRCAVNQFAESGSAFIYVRRTDLSIRYEKLAIRLNERLHQHATFPYQNLSWLYTTQGRLKEAFAIALDAMRVAETPDSVVDAAGYESLARVYFMTGDLDKCAEFSKKAFAYFIKDPGAVEYPGVLLFRYIQVLLERQRAAEALQFLRILDDPWSHAPLRDADRANYPLSLAECFRVLRRPDSAERYYAKTIALKPPVSVSGPWFYISTYVCLATFYTENQRYAEAGHLLDTLLGKTFRALLPTMFLQRTLLLRYEVDSARRNYPRAMAALRQYQLLHDSLTNYRLNKQLADLGIRSETERTAQHITDLEKQSALQTRLQQSMQRHNRLVRNSLLAGATLLAVFAGILYSRWRIRRRMSLQLQKANADQQKLLGEKEWLLREIHHRVKNNLQIVISLLNMQAGQLKDEIAISAFEEIGARVNTISLVHKKLYQDTGDLASIDMREYIRELVSFLRETFGARQSIAFNLDVQHLILDPAQCIPVGLILNEAITNAIKYAFPAKAAASSPVINISLKEDPADHITLIVADNGIGLPAGFDPAHSQSLGLQLIHTLTLQLDGTLDIITQPHPSHPEMPNGLTLLIHFPWKEPMPPSQHDGIRFV